MVLERDCSESYVVNLTELMCFLVESEMRFNSLLCDRMNNY